jgi:SNF2 family DNA or RNA helicase
MQAIAIAIEKYIKRLDTGSVSRGRQIFLNQGVRPVKLEIEKRNALFKVSSQSFLGEYTVSLIGFTHYDTIKNNCTCPVGLNCKHVVAAMLYLKNHLSNPPAQLSAEDKAEEEAAIKIPVEWQETKLLDLDSDSLSKTAGRNEWQLGYTVFMKNLVFVQTAENRKVLAQVLDGENTYQIELEKLEIGLIQAKCDCRKRTFSLCEHKVALVLTLNKRFGRTYLDTLVDPNTQKRQLLAEYGYTLEDNWADKFQFNSFGGKVKMIVLDTSLRKLSEFENWGQFHQRIGIKVNPGRPLNEHLPIRSYDADTGVGFVLKTDLDTFPYFSIQPVTGKLKKDRKSFVSNLEEFFPDFPPSLISYSEQQKGIIELCSKLSSKSILGYFNTFSVRNLNSVSADEVFEYANMFSGEELFELRKYVHGLLLSHLDMLNQEEMLFYSSQQVGIGLRSLETVKIMPKPIEIVVKVEEDKEFIWARLVYLYEGQVIATPLQLRSVLFLSDGNTFYLPTNPGDAALVNEFGPDNCIKANNKDKEAFIEKFILPIQLSNTLELPEKAVTKSESSNFKPLVYLAELNDTHLLITPVFRYGNTLVEKDSRQVIWAKNAKKYSQIERDLEKEEVFFKAVQALHPKFEIQNDKEFFHLLFDDALENGWFFNLFEELKKLGADVLGLKELQHFKYNPNKPTVKLTVGSGIDWFDVNVEVSFGDQHITLKELRKAVMNDQKFIQLEDGTLGILPEEWLNQYRTMLRLAKFEKTGMKVSKHHFSLIDELYQQIDDMSVRRELDEKREKLKNFNNIAQITIPKGVQAELRPYQEAGVNWLNFLNEFKFGGCLADDMGLGKTLQALTFLQHYKNIETEKRPSMVVCPNTLVFNWENEIKKFCPDMKYTIHHGQQRRLSPENLLKADLVITTYGTLRSDIEWIKDIAFGYTVLDESQAIKNPEAKITKAVNLIQTKHKLILTGTPVQNNTFDLYAQMNFLNPGMLGGMDFFKENFAVPIDRDRSEEKSTELKKLIYPFMLRRTKEQVAKDLPEKTEMVLWCEMGANQRRVYDAFKNEYRDFLMQRIADSGIEQSNMHVLQGLMRLRQICDSPTLIPDTRYHTTESVKAEELIREITENVSNHKALIFSQFLGMLDIVGKKLTEHSIPFAYLDGKTKNRKEVVEKFQSDEECKVFLISLTAGGTGLNLTAADYVYIVDPWWNPAVEQQAIDRTHRIGQTKNIFAYKMICKDTVEEKILLLQEKKKKLAGDIVGDDSAFVKKLSKDDIDFLFS